MIGETQDRWLTAPSHYIQLRGCTNQMQDNNILTSYNMYGQLLLEQKKLNNRNVQEYHTDEINTYLSSCHYGSKCEGLKCSNGVGYEELTNQTTWNNIECNSHNKRISYLWYSNKKNSIVFYVGAGEENSKNWHYFVDIFFHSTENFTMSIHQFISSPFTTLTLHYIYPSVLKWIHLHWFAWSLGKEEQAIVQNYKWRGKPYTG